jgi:hypothetical protein
MMNAFREKVGVIGLRQFNGHLLNPLIKKLDPGKPVAALIDATDLHASCSGFKKSTGCYSAAGAALGGCTLKSRQSHYFVGYLLGA